MKTPLPSDEMTSTLAAVHDSISSRHNQQRECLLRQLPAIDTCPTSAEHRHAWRQKLIGGVGAAAAAVALLVWLFTPPSASVALERMFTALEMVNSYTFRMESIHRSGSGASRDVKKTTITGRWRTEPFGLHASTRIVESDPSLPEAQQSKVLVDIEETHATNGGILIDHLKQEFWRIDERMDASSVGYPLIAIFQVRQRRGQILRELGTKQIDNRTAWGVELRLDQEIPESDLGPQVSEQGEPATWDWQDMVVEVWVDSATDLPIEFTFFKQDGESTTKYHFSDFQWNTTLEADAFTPSDPRGYTQLAESPWATE